MDELISRQAAIDAAMLDVSCIRTHEFNAGATRAANRIKQLPTIQSDISYIISETLHECGIYGEEATIKLIGTLKRLRRDDLLPPCAR